MATADLVVIAISLLVAAIVQGLSGLGFALVAAPSVSLLIPGSQAIGLVNFLAFFQAIWQIWRETGTVQWSIMKGFVPAILVGVFVGFLGFGRSPLVSGRGPSLECVFPSEADFQLKLSGPLPSQIRFSPWCRAWARARSAARSARRFSTRQSTRPRESYESCRGVGGVGNPGRGQSAPSVHCDEQTGTLRIPEAGARVNPPCPSPDRINRNLRRSPSKTEFGAALR